MTTTPSPENLAFATHVLDKRFELYGWCEAKIATLATVNSIILSALFVIGGSHFNASTVVRKLEFGFAAGFLGASLLIVLWHIEPAMRSGTLPKGSRNLRSVVGVGNHKTKDAYHDAIRDATPADMLRATTDQIFGMNRNIWRNQRAIKFAVVFDVLGLAMFALTVGQSSFSESPEKSKTSTVVNSVTMR